MFKKLVCFMVILVFPLFSFADAMVINVTPQSPQFKITEPTNSTTGYQWVVQYDHTLLTLKGEKSYVPNSKLMGAGGKTIWVFNATPQAFVKPHTQTMIRFVYERPWNPKDNPKEMFIVVEFSST